MLYLIDGHNLIPKLGLRLDSFDDEMDLVARLQEFSRLSRNRVEVYFDGAPAGQASTRQEGMVAAHFVRQGSSADEAIEVRLVREGRKAKNWTVVSSDGRVQRAAQSAGSGMLSSEEFAQLMGKTQAARISKSKRDAALSPDEIEEWLNIFDRKKG
jgi:predicted RNA-binding protein with PIN domain